MNEFITLTELTQKLIIAEMEKLNLNQSNMDEFEMISCESKIAAYFTLWSDYTCIIVKAGKFTEEEITPICDNLINFMNKRNNK